MVFKKRAVTAFSIVFLSPLLTACVSNTSSGLRISGAGATFPAKLYTRWFADLAQSGGPRVNYQAIGSGAGRKAFLDETVDFGASDDPMKSNDIKKVKRGLVQIPIVGGTIAFGYKYDCDLKLSQEKAVQVAMGMIKDWKELGCPPGKLTWVHRSDGSGTTKAFTNSMQSFSKTWTIGIGKSVNWPAGVGGKGNAGVAGVIRNTPGAIGYLSQSYVKGNIKAAYLQNLSGEFLQPNLESGAKALNNIKLDSNLAGTNANPIAEGAYPIATLTWVLAYETGNGRKTQAMRDTLSTLLSDEYQEKAYDLGFIPLIGKNLSAAREAVFRIGK